MRKIVIANRKGGVGKSTTAVNLSAALAKLEYRVLLIDTDSQGHCSIMLGVEPTHGLAELIDGTVQPSGVIVKAREHLDLIAGDKSLGAITKEISRKDYRAELVLTEALKPFEGKYDFAIVDSAPGYTPLSVNVIFYANEALVPVAMEGLSAQGLTSFLREIEPIRNYSNLEVRYIVPTFVDGRVKKSAEIFDQLRDNFNEKLTDPIRYSVKISECATWGKTIYEYAPADRGARDYLNLTKRILNHG